MPDFSKVLSDGCYVDGQWVSADDGNVSEIRNPATGRVLGPVPYCGRNETRRAIAAASTAFPGWAALTGRERAGYLQLLAAKVLENAEQLAQLLTAEQGKSLAEARGEIGFSAAYIRWFAEEAVRVYGEIVPSPWAGSRILVTKQPVGVVGAITPWNFPSSMIARKIGPALAAGCTIVVKPAPQTPLSGLAWGRLADMAGLPPGVLNFVTGDAVEIGGELTENAAVRKITFTGSTNVGKILVRQSSETLKKVSMELGGNAPFIVFDDADLDKAVEGAIAAKFRNSGQTCVCANRFIVQDGIHDAFVRRLADAVGELKVGDGIDPGVQQGPLIDEGAVLKVQSHIADAVSKGAEVVVGGTRHELGGTFFSPTVLANVPPSAVISKEETFGPVAPVFRFTDEKDAVAIANDTEFGLASYLYTKDLSRAFRVSEALQCGMVGINEGLITTEVAPFGGVKQSGLGREGSRHGIEDYLDLKYVCVGGLLPA